MNAYSIITFSLLGIAGLYTIFVLYNYTSNYIVIEPVFTSTAYQPNGFYDYYAHTCDTRCLTVPISVDDTNLKVKFSDTYNAKLIFALLGYHHVTDIDVSNNPNILNNKTVIVLHNEYVTQQEYDDIVKQHSINFYPNALYARVNMNDNGTLTLIGDRTHQKNYFNWTEDNTSRERSNEGHPNYCTNQTFEKIENDYRLNCWVQSPFDIIKYIFQMRNLQ